MRIQVPLLQLQSASLAFGHVPLLDQVDFVLEDKERVCLIGRNGTGKSTLLNVLVGNQELDAGKVWLEAGTRIAKLAQEVPASADATLYETVTAGLGNLSTLLTEFHRISHSAGDADSLKAMDRVQTQIDQLDGWDVSARVEAVLDQLHLPADARMSECSGGIRRRAMLGQALISQPDVLVLDEPTNHLDIESIAALETAIADYRGSVVFVTHDRQFIDGLATRIVELDRGTLRSYPGNYAAYQIRKARELAAEEDAAKKFDQHLAEEEVWIRQGIKARRTRNEGRVRRLEALREERRARRDRQGQVRMQVDQGNASGKIVLEVEQISFGYDAAPIVKDFSTTLLRGDRVGLIGSNGSGKSTLLKLMIGDLTPDAGEVTLGTQLKLAYFDQERMQLDPERSVRDNLAPGTDQIQVGDRQQHVISYLRDFLFAPERVRSPVKTLSGGERNRLLLAKLFAQPANFLVLDEPTNDLDVETLELLEELLAEFSGTLLLVSHDRAFLDRTVTQVLVMEGEGKVGEYVGGYSDWLRQRPAAPIVDMRRSQSAADRPQSKTDAAADKPARADKLEKPEKKASEAPKLTQEERKELKALPGRIEKLEAQQAELTQQMSAPDFYQQAQSEMQPVLDKLAETEAALAAAYNRWEELEAR